MTEAALLWLELSRLTRNTLRDADGVGDYLNIFVRGYCFVVNCFFLDFLLFAFHLISKLGMGGSGNCRYTEDIRAFFIRSVLLI